MNAVKKIRVAFFLPSLEAGGTERNVVNIVNNINKDVFSISLVLSEKKGDFLKKIDPSVEITILDAKSSYGTFIKLIKYFKSENPDIFVSAFTRFNIICLLAHFFSGSDTKIIATEHAVFSLLPLIAKTLYRKIFAIVFLPIICRIVYPLSDAIVCVSKGIADDLLARVGCESKISIIYNPVASDTIKNLAEDKISDFEMLDLKLPIILAAGRLEKCKDYPTLIKAFKLVSQKIPSRLLILGKGVEEKNLKNLVFELGLSENVMFLGFQDNPYKYMKKASVFVLSSAQEGFGNVIIEAMACGVPVVSSDCPVGPREIINNGINGFLVEPKSEDKLAEAITKILSNPQMAEKFSQAGKIRAEYFSVGKSVSEYEQLFKKVLHG